MLTAGAPGGTFDRRADLRVRPDRGWEATRGPIPLATLSLPAGAKLPTFLAPPATAAELVVYHTSCRKPHGGGRDGLALALTDMATRFSATPAPQPHLLVMSGDQIYADEVGHPLMPRVLRVATDLIGVDESGRLRPRRRSAAAARSPTRSATRARPPITCGATASSWRCTSSRGRRCCGRRRCSQFPQPAARVLDVDPDVSEDVVERGPPQPGAASSRRSRRCGGCWPTCRR